MKIRKENGYEIRPGADLYEANLGGADLGEAALREADLLYADLREVNLERANLWEANLEGAYLLGMIIDDGQGNVYKCQEDGWGIVRSISA
jgi:uncharacterized protein YjbI with pentapeptide repeats